jgi:hypothetical protein
MSETAASEAGIPTEIVAGLDHYEVAPALRSLIARVAVHRSLTAEPPGVGYVAVRPYVWGTVSAYFHKTYVDVAVSPDMAEKLHRSHGWKLVKVNGTTGFIRIEAGVLGSPELEALATQTLLSAVDKSEAGTAYEGGRSGGVQSSQSADLCPACGIEMLGGHCDVCD